MASDIPEAHAGPDAMARCLASYINDPDKIFRRVKAEFGSSPCHETISAMRARHLQPAYISEPAKPYDGYYPGDAAASLETTNALFLARLKNERDSCPRNPQIAPVSRLTFSHSAPRAVTEMSPEQSEAA
jgi:hypothetical protein